MEACYPLYSQEAERSSHMRLLPSSILQNNPMIQSTIFPRRGFFFSILRIHWQRGGLIYLEAFNPIAFPKHEIRSFFIQECHELMCDRVSAKWQLAD